MRDFTKDDILLIKHHLYQIIYEIHYNLYRFSSKSGLLTLDQYITIKREINIIYPYISTSPLRKSLRPLIELAKLRLVAENTKFLKFKPVKHILH